MEENAVEIPDEQAENIGISKKIQKAAKKFEAVSFFCIIISYDNLLQVLLQNIINFRQVVHKTSKHPVHKSRRTI